MRLEQTLFDLLRYINKIIIIIIIIIKYDSKRGDLLANIHAHVLPALQQTQLQPTGAMTTQTCRTRT